MFFNYIQRVHLREVVTDVNVEYTVAPLLRAMTQHLYEVLGVKVPTDVLGFDLDMSSRPLATLLA